MNFDFKLLFKLNTLIIAILTLMLLALFYQNYITISQLNQEIHDLSTKIVADSEKWDKLFDSSGNRLSQFDQYDVLMDAYLRIYEDKVQLLQEQLKAKK